LVFERKKERKKNEWNKEERTKQRSKTGWRRTKFSNEKALAVGGLCRLSRLACTLACLYTEQQNK
jgi:hypothetical protein